LASQFITPNQKNIEYDNKVKLVCSKEQGSNQKRNSWMKLEAQKIFVDTKRPLYSTKFVLVFFFIIVLNNDIKGGINYPKHTKIYLLK